MEKKILLNLVLTLSMSLIMRGQGTNPYKNVFPQGTIIYDNIPYNNDTLEKHQLDIYLPAKITGKLPLIVFIHGGAWLGGNKYSDMSYMTNTVAAMLNNGMAVVSIDYRFASNAVFPAIVQDCNRAVSFLYDNAEKYRLDKNRFAVMGFSAGGHLATLLGLSKNNNVPSFFMPKTTKSFKFKAVVDFYGPTDLVLLPGNADEKSPESILIGAAPLARPDLAKIASPITYVDKNDPPFLIIHGEKDDIVSNKQSKLLNSWLNVLGVQNELIIVKDAPHFGEMYDTEDIRKKVIDFLKKNLTH
jgi:acetyl esterase/lipase